MERHKGSAERKATPQSILVYSSPPAGAIDPTGPLGGSQPFTAADDGTVLTADSTQATGLSWKAAVLGIANEGTRQGRVFDSIAAGTATLRTLQADTTPGNEGTTISTGATTVSVGTALTAANVGAGAQLFVQKSPAAILQLRSLIGGTGVAATQNASDVTLSLAASGVAPGGYRMMGALVDAYGRITAAVNGGYGGVAVVDQANGLDSQGMVNGYPFMTISAAMTAAAAFTPNLVIVYPGTYNEALNVPAGVKVTGASIQTATVQMLGVTTPTTLVTMGANSTLINLQLTLTSAANANLVGVAFAGSNNSNAKLRSVSINVTNTGATTATTYGIASNCTGFPPDTNLAISGDTLTVTGSGAGATYGVYLQSGAHKFGVYNTQVTVTGGGTPTGCVTAAVAGMELEIGTCIISGAAADITQGAGSTVLIRSTALVNSTAGGLGFATQITPSLLTFALSGALPTSGITRYVYPGRQNEAFLPRFGASKKQGPRHRRGPVADPDGLPRPVDQRVRAGVAGQHPDGHVHGAEKRREYGRDRGRDRDGRRLREGPGHRGERHVRREVAPQLLGDLMSLQYVSGAASVTTPNDYTVVVSLY
ncbi:MAG: hypothetical protein KGL39_01010 [Patescibacteria group bacterium]|nr:hypothetical protein [Patescibacteria group bacterium]